MDSGKKKQGKNRKHVTFVLANQNEAKWLLIDNPFQKKNQTWKRRIVSCGFARSLDFFRCLIFRLEGFSVQKV
jgi:hypothetical protein